MDNKNFEKARKTIEFVFDVIFLLNLFYLIIGGIFKILYATGAATVDLFTYSQLIIQAIITLILYFPTRLANKGHFAAGIIGIIVAVFEIFCGGVIWKIVGVALLIDSIIFLIKFKKFPTKENSSK